METSPYSMPMLDDLIPILKDYSELIDKNADVKREKDEMLKL